METTKNYSLSLQLGIILMAFTLYGVYDNFNSLKYLGADPSQFQQTSGRIISSNIGMNGTRGGWKFYIQYEYYIEGNKMTSERVHFGYQASSNPSYAQEYINKYPIGKEVIVYYNPDDPRESVLEPQVKWYGQLYIFTAGILFSLLFLYLSWKSKSPD